MLEKIKKINLSTELILLVAVLISLIIWIAIDRRASNVQRVIDPIEQMSSRVDSIIEKREQDKQILIDHIDSLKSSDTVFIHQQTRVINRYYYENNRINNLDADGQFGLLSKNLAKGAAREQSGYYDVPDRRRGENSK
jgi:hypothetical protein